ncbi:biofilm architecture maintenance protein Mba [Acidimicrobiaceae bacterium]|nr:biofilm architecture maintenance protein Mba [Acidimicrobiaceae bacterium]
MFISASIGVATYRKDATKSAAELLSNADSAMYWAKDAGRNCVAVFDEAMEQRVKDRLAKETALYRALERKELRLVHQPIIDIGLGDVTGFEALMRWDMQDGTSVPPIEFISIAEETGLLCRLSMGIARSSHSFARLDQRGNLLTRSNHVGECFCATIT